MKKKKEKLQLQNIMGIIALLVIPVIAFFLMEFYGHNPLEEVREKARWFNIILFELIAWSLFFLTGRAKMALSIELLAAMIFGLANTYIVRFRTNPIVPWDFYSLKTAASVASNYDLAPDKQMVTVVLLFLSLFVLVQLIELKMPLFRLKKKEIFTKENAKVLLLRAVSTTAAVLTLISFIGKLQDDDFQTRNYLYPFLFTPAHMTKVNGIAVTFAMNLEYVTVEKPEGYDREEIETLLASYEKEAKETDSLPNIIVIMNEAFADMKSVGEFTPSEDYMPFVHQLQTGIENTITGNLWVSVCGGNTANSEFEFLTGNTMAFLPQGSIPYQQYIKKELPALPAYLKTLGYQTIAAHPYYASGWERDTIYPMLGFDRSIFIEEYDKTKKLRSYISDEECTDKIIQLYEEKEAETPLFLFNVTMQNHSGYSELYENFIPDITVEGIDNVSVEQYLSLVKRSDMALKKLVSYFSQVEEDTIIVFFGDHQPNDAVAGPILSLNGKSVSELTEEELGMRYEVPYVIWANYDIKEEIDADTSLNYLGGKVLEAANIKLPAYQSFLQELEKEYPLISALQVQKADGAIETAQEEKEGLRLYQSIQYYQLFDK